MAVMNYERAVLSTIRKELSRLTPVIHALIGLAGRWVKRPLPKKFSNPLAFQLPTQPMTAPYLLIPRGVKDTVLNACPASGCRRIDLFRLPEQPSFHSARNHHRPSGAHAINASTAIIPRKRGHILNCELLWGMDLMRKLGVEEFG